MELFGVFLSRKGLIVVSRSLGRGLTFRGCTLPLEIFSFVLFYLPLETKSVNRWLHVSCGLLHYGEAESFEGKRVLLFFVLQMTLPLCFPHHTDRFLPLSPGGGPRVRKQRLGL